jgi:predicted amidophosphoribosyltransferase
LQEGDRCLFFGEYFAGKGYQGGGTNQLMFNFKTLPSIARTNPARRSYKESAIATVATGLREVLGRNQIERLTFVPIPPSKTPDHPDYDDRLTRALTMGCTGFNSDIRLLLRRVSSTESDHRTGARLTPEALHSLLELDSAAAAAKPLREAIVLFDDVITTGKSFKCCERRLREVIPATMPIIGLFVARRILRDPFDDFENLS